MGQVKRVLITGATGFIGAHTVRAARDAGYDVLAASRREPLEQWADDPGITPLQLDLAHINNNEELAKAVVRCDAVIHLAASVSNDAQKVQSNTIAATENLANALRASPEIRVILASSIAVYDHAVLNPYDLLTEETSLIAAGTAHDHYAAGKLAQERAMTGLENPVFVLRPGIVYDSDRLWNAHLGIGLGPILVVPSHSGEVPMCHVKRCAATLVAAIEAVDLKPLNVFDAIRPTRKQLSSKLKTSGINKTVIPCPWSVMAGLLRIVSFLTPAAKQRGLLKASNLSQRLMALRYNTEALHQAFPNLPDYAPDWSAQ